VAWWADRRAAAGRSVIGNAWVYALSMGVYCTAWTYFGSVGRAASGGVWFLPIYLGPTLAMVLAWLVLRKMVRIARTWRITSIADFIASRYGKSRAAGRPGDADRAGGRGALRGAAAQGRGQRLPAAHRRHGARAGAALGVDVTLVIALVLAGFTIAFGTRHLDNTERHEGMVAAIAAESVVKLLAFCGRGRLRHLGPVRRAGRPVCACLGAAEIARVLRADPARPFAFDQWFALLLLAGLSVLLLPRQFQVMVVENVDERHIRRAAWAFPAYLLLINLFVLPIALGGMLYFGGRRADPETFVLSLPLAAGMPALALLAFIGGLSAATGMVIVEAIAVSTMVCNDLVLPVLLRCAALARGARARPHRPRLLFMRRAVIVACCCWAGCTSALRAKPTRWSASASSALPRWRSLRPRCWAACTGRAARATARWPGLAGGALLWAYTLMLPSIAKSGWMDAGFLQHGPFGLALLRPEALLGLVGHGQPDPRAVLEPAGQCRLYVAVSLAGRRAPPRPARRCCLWMCSNAPRKTACSGAAAPGGRPGGAGGRFMGPARAQALFEAHTRELGGLPHRGRPQARAVCRNAAGRRHRQRVGAGDGGLGGGRGHAGADRRDAHRRRSQRTAPPERTAQEPGQAQGRLHEQRHARAAHAADQHPRADRTDARRTPRWKQSSASSSWAWWWVRPSA
jgi:Na+/proline symporter